MVLSGIRLSVVLVRLLLELFRAVVAADNRQGDTADGLVEAIAILDVSGLNAEVDRLGGTDDGRRGRDWLGSAVAGIGTGGCGGRVSRGLGDTAVGFGPAVGLVAAVARTFGFAVVVQVLTPLLELEALEGSGPASVSEAGADLLVTRSFGHDAAKFVLP